MDWAVKDFTDDTDSSKYASIILYSVDKHKRQSNTEYTSREQALEMLNQVSKGNKYAKSATKLLTELLIYNFFEPKSNLDPKLDVKNLAILLTDHVDTSPQQTVNNMNINAVTTNQRQNRSSQTSTMKQPKCFQRNGPIQCEACNANDHCIKVDPEEKQEDLRICSIGEKLSNT